MDAMAKANREAWEGASRKHIREYDDLLAQAAAGSSLNAVERELLAGILSHGPEVVHLQSGHGLDDTALARAGAKSVVGVDYSVVTAGAAQRRADELGLRCDRSYFARSHVNDSFPARGAVEWQHTLGEIVTAVIAAGMELLSLAEYPDPFWRPGGIRAAAWDGRMPNAYSLLARRPAT